MAKSSVRLCIDRVVSYDMKIKAAEHAVKENPVNKPVFARLPGVSAHPLKIAIETGKKWMNGKTLNVAFLDGTAIQRQKTIEKATMWCAYANVKFNFKGKSKSEIRISFKADPGSWSAVGTDCLLTDAFPKDQPTMNFGWCKDDTDDVEWRRVVVHEFGHSLGAIHEHQNPKSGLKWNLPAVYKYFSGPPNNWSKDEIDFNIVQKYSLDQINGTKFDIKSIMLYSFPPELIIGGKGTPNNTQLSAGDEKFIGSKSMYPLGK